MPDSAGIAIATIDGAQSKEYNFVILELELTKHDAVAVIFQLFGKIETDQTASFIGSNVTFLEKQRFNHSLPTHFSIHSSSSTLHLKPADRYQQTPNQIEHEIDRLNLSLDTLKSAVIDLRSRHDMRKDENLKKLEDL